MIYLVTNRKLASRNFYEQIEDMCKCGIDRIILREKDLNYKQYLELARKVQNICNAYKIPLIVNGNLQVAQDINAYAYHSNYKEFIERGKLYKRHGVSIHSVQEAINVQKLGGDYILAGHIFPTKCKEGLKPRGIGFIRKLKESVDLPIIGIGGINPQTVQKIYREDIAGIAFMSYFMESLDIEKSLKNLRIY